MCTKLPGAPAGLVAATWEAETTLIEGFGTEDPPKAMLCTLMKHRPEIETLVPPAGGPEFGKIFSMSGPMPAAAQSVRAALMRPYPKLLFHEQLPLGAQTSPATPPYRPPPTLSAFCASNRWISRTPR